MDKNELFKVVKDALIVLDQDIVIANVSKGLEMRIGPLEIIENGILAGLSTIGEQFETEEIFLPELMQAAMIVQTAMDILQPENQKNGCNAQEERRRRSWNCQGGRPLYR